MEKMNSVKNLMHSMILQSCGELDTKQGCQQAGALEISESERNQAETIAAQVKITNSTWKCKSDLKNHMWTSSFPDLTTGVG